MRKILRLQPISLIIDTAVSTYPGSIVEIHDEAIALESAGAVGDPGVPERAVVGIPSKPALELMLRAAGFAVDQYYDWQHANIRWVEDLKDYYLGVRLTLAAIAAAEGTSASSASRENRPAWNTDTLGGVLI